MTHAEIKRLKKLDPFRLSVWIAAEAAPLVLSTADDYIGDPDNGWSMDWLGVQVIGYMGSDVGGCDNTDGALVYIAMVYTLIVNGDWLC